MLLLIKHLLHHFDDKAAIFWAVNEALKSNLCFQKLAISIIFKYKLEAVLN